MVESKRLGGLAPIQHGPDDRRGREPRGIVQQDVGTRLTGGLGDESGLQEVVEHFVQQPYGEALALREAGGGKHPLPRLHGARHLGRDGQRQLHAGAAAGVPGALLPPIGCRMLAGEGEFRAEQQDLPARIDPGQQDRNDGETTIELAVLDNSHLEPGAKPEPGQEADRRDETARQRRAEAHARVRHEHEHDHEERHREQQRGTLPQQEPAPSRQPVGTDPAVEVARDDAGDRECRGSQRQEGDDDHQGEVVGTLAPQGTAGRAPNLVETVLDLGQHADGHPEQHGQADAAEGAEADLRDLVEDPIGVAGELRDEVGDHPGLRAIRPLGVRGELGAEACDFVPDTLAGDLVAAEDARQG